MSRDIQKMLNKMSPGARYALLGDILYDLINAANSGIMVAAGLAIKAGSSPTVKAGSNFLANVAGTLVRVAANTDMPAIAGTLATAKSAAWAFYIDSAGNRTVSTKTADAASHAAAIALLSSAPSGSVTIGFIVVDNASGSNFVGGTTALDAAGVTTTYYSLTGSEPFGTNAIKALGAR